MTGLRTADLLVDRDEVDDTGLATPGDAWVLRMLSLQADIKGLRDMKTYILSPKLVP